MDDLTESATATQPRSLGAHLHSRSKLFLEEMR